MKIANILRVALHIAIFLIAFFIFFVGLVIGLAYNPDLGTVLWILAGALTVGNCVWMVALNRRKRDARSRPPPTDK